MLIAEVFILWVSTHVKRKVWERQKAAVVPLDFWMISDSDLVGGVAPDCFFI